MLLYRKLSQKSYDNEQSWLSCNVDNFVYKPYQLRLLTWINFNHSMYKSSQAQ